MTDPTPPRQRGLSRTARYFISLGLGFVTYRIAVESVGLVALLLGAIVAVAAWALIGAIGH
jgi:hypothetical protein